MNPSKFFDVQVLKFEFRLCGCPSKISTETCPTMSDLLGKIEKNCPQPLKPMLFDRKMAMLSSDESYLRLEDSLLYVMMEPTEEEKNEARLFMEFQERRKEAEEINK